MPSATSSVADSQRIAALLGSTVDDRYRFDERIGAGGLGEVFRASHLRMERSFAIKLLQPTVATQPDFVERFDREAKALSRLSHPYCVEVTDYGVSSEHGPYIVMELLEGAALSQITKKTDVPGLSPSGREGPGPALNLDAALELCRKVLLGLEHAHEQGIAHRDLKPDNIMVVPDPVKPGAYLPKILDFGLAKIHAGDAEGSALTQAGLIIGTPYYMSPERIAKPQSADAKAGDLYALGVLLYELCCGRRPFVGPDMMATLTLHMTQAPRPPRELVPALPAALESLILRALEKRPEDRFASARALRDALAHVLPLSGTAASLPCGAAAHVSGEAETVSASAQISTSELGTAELGTSELGVSGSAQVAETTGPVAATTSTRLERPISVKKKRGRGAVPLWGVVLGAVALLAAGAIVTLVLVSGDPRPPPLDRPGSVAGKPEPQEPGQPGPGRPGDEDHRKIVRRPNLASRGPRGKGLAPELRRATRMWSKRWSRRRAVRRFGRYLARNRDDARGHLHVARLYLLNLWAADGIDTLQHALKAEPTLKLDDATLVGLAFAYRGKRSGTARRLLVQHAGARASRVLLTAAAAIRDKGLRKRQLTHAQELGLGNQLLDRQLLALAQKPRCSDRRALLDVIVRHEEPLVGELLALLKRQPCLGKSARRHLARRGRGSKRRGSKRRGSKR